MANHSQDPVAEPVNRLLDDMADAVRSAVVSVEQAAVRSLAEAASEPVERVDAESPDEAASPAGLSPDEIREVSEALLERDGGPTAKIEGPA